MVNGMTAYVVIGSIIVMFVAFITGCMKVAPEIKFEPNPIYLEINRCDEWDKIEKALLKNKQLCASRLHALNATVFCTRIKKHKGKHHMHSALDVCNYIW